LTPEDLTSEEVPVAVLFLGYLIATLWSLLSIGIIYYFLKGSLQTHQGSQDQDHANPLDQFEKFPGELSPEAKLWLERRGVDPESGVVLPPNLLLDIPPKDH